jgi:hypothetical protein
MTLWTGYSAPVSWVRTGERGEPLVPPAHDRQPISPWRRWSVRAYVSEMQALPNYFVGLGLVMTFLGLIAGLWFASQGMRTADMIEARAALVHLLNSATFKFLTSVAGIAMSLVVSLAFRISVQSLRIRLDLLCDRIEEATACATRPAASQTGTDGGAVLAERITQLVQSIDRLESAIVKQTAIKQSSPVG